MNPIQRDLNSSLPMREVRQALGFSQPKVRNISNVPKSMMRPLAAPQNQVVHKDESGKYEVYLLDKSTTDFWEKYNTPKDKKELAAICRKKGLNIDEHRLVGYRNAKGVLFKFAIKLPDREYQTTSEAICEQLDEQPQIIDVDHFIPPLGAEHKVVSINSVAVNHDSVDCCPSFYRQALEPQSVILQTCGLQKQSSIFEDNHTATNSLTKHIHTKICFKYTPKDYGLNLFIFHIHKLKKDPNYCLNTPPEQVKAYILKKFKAEIVSSLEDALTYSDVCNLFNQNPQNRKDLTPIVLTELLLTLQTNIDLLNSVDSTLALFKDFFAGKDLTGPAFGKKIKTLKYYESIQEYETLLIKQVTLFCEHFRETVTKKLNA